MIQETYSEILKGASSGFGAGFTDLYRDEPSAIATHRNIYLFSGAKTSQQLKAYQELLVDDNGKIRSWTEYRRKVLALNKEYNTNYLQAEYQTAKISGKAAKQWEQFQENKDLFPNLKYKTVGDDRVRDEHDKLDGIVKPIEDSFWDTHYPPNGFRCRCDVQQTSEAVSTTIPEVKIDKGFGNNVGKTGKVFDENGHPYFSQTLTDNDFRENFELSKLKTPLIKTKGIEVSPWADVADLKQNLDLALLIRKRLKDRVQINPHINRKGWKNPELTINKLIADVKNVKGITGIRTGFRAARKQGAVTIVFNIDQIEELNVNKLIRVLRGKVSEERGTWVKFVYIKKGTKVVKLSRNQILNNDFEALKKTIKSTT